MATEMTIDPSAATARSTPSTNGVMDEAKTVAERQRRKRTRS